MVVDVRVIVRFIFKRSFSRIKSNLKDTYLKRPFEILKDLLESKKLNQTLPITIQSHCPSCGRPFARSKMQSKQAHNWQRAQPYGTPYKYFYFYFFFSGLDNHFSLLSLNSPTTKTVVEGQTFPKSLIITSRKFVI